MEITRAWKSEHVRVNRNTCVEIGHVRGNRNTCVQIGHVRGNRDTCVEIGTRACKSAHEIGFTHGELSSANRQHSCGGNQNKSLRYTCVEIGHVRGNRNTCVEIGTRAITAWKSEIGTRACVGTRAWKSEHVRGNRNTCVDRNTCVEIGTRRGNRDTCVRNRNTCVEIGTRAC